MDLFTLTGVFLVITAIAVPVAYLFSWLFHSILLGTIATLVLSAAVLFKGKIPRKKIRLDASSVLFLIFSLTFSTWMMFKTFHAGAGGELFVGSNNVFDFGHTLGLVRSFSWGGNIPMMSPFEAGLPFFYHFLFYFWVALLEYFRVPIVWAMNVPSILSFSALLVVVYYFPQIVAKQKPFVGWIAAILTITNSSLTFWKLLAARIDIWHLPAYPFAGPFDGSTISIFVTLNNYVNQRHLAFSIALGLFLIILVVMQVKRIHLVGLLTGVMFLWNIPVSLLTGLVIFTALLMQKKWNKTVIFSAFAFVGVLLSLVPFLQQIRNITGFFSSEMSKSAAHAASLASWSPVSYLWQNLGVLPFIALVGLFVFPREKRFIAGILFGFFVLFCLLAIIGHRGFDQKFYSYLIIGINMIAATGLALMWKKTKILALLVGLVVTISGFVDLMPIKNEFAYPLVGKDVVPLISWIHTSTLKNSVFVSYSDIIDPVVLAGRTNYFGFFGNIGWYDRSADVRRIYAGDIVFAKAKNVSYVLFPKWQKKDFPYKIQPIFYHVAYEDARYVVYAVK